MTPTSDGQPLVAATKPWPLWRRWLLNFGTVYLAGYFLLAGQSFLLPATWKHAVANAVHQALFRSELPPLQPTGSGDTARDWTMLLLNLVLALLLGSVRTWLERRQPRQYEAQVNLLRSFLRAALIFWLLTYGLIKFNLGQFGLLRDSQLTQTYGESSPMGLLWRFMAASPAYQWLGGVAETLPALLLLHRRTVTPGALVAAITMTNVFALNLFYDVPVKIFSAHLLMAAVVLLLMDAPRLLAFAFGKAAPPIDLPPSSKVAHWAAWMTTVAVLVGAVWLTVQGAEAWRIDRQRSTVTHEPLKVRGFHPVSEFPYNR